MQESLSMSCIWPNLKGRKRRFWFQTKHNNAQAKRGAVQGENSPSPSLYGYWNRGIWSKHDSIDCGVLWTNLLVDPRVCGPVKLPVVFGVLKFDGGLFATNGGEKRSSRRMGQDATTSSPALRITVPQHCASKAVRACLSALPPTTR